MHSDQQSAPPTPPPAKGRSLSHKGVMLRALLASVVIIFFAVVTNLAAGSLLSDWSLDLSAGKIYSLSPQTRTLLKQIDEPIDIRFYASRNLSELGSGIVLHAARTRHLLERMVRASGGRLRVQFIAPRTFSEEEDQAIADGIAALRFPGPSQARGYLGMHGRNSVDLERRISYLAVERSELLEQDIVHMLRTLIAVQRPVVAVLGQVPFQGLAGLLPPYHLTEKLQSFYDLRFLNPLPLKEQIAQLAQADVLILAQPLGLDDALLRAVDHYAHTKGRILLFLDPYMESMGGTFGASLENFDRLQPLLRSWGIGFTGTQLVADPSLAQKAQVLTDKGSVTTSYPLWLELTSERMATFLPSLTGLTRIKLRSTGHLSALDEGSFTPLLRSSKRASVVLTREMVTTSNPLRVLSNLTPAGQEFVLAARIQASAQTVLWPPSSQDAAAADEDSAVEQLQNTLPGEAGEYQAPTPAAVVELPSKIEPSVPLDIIVVADSDFLADAAWLQQGGLLNQRFFVPSADNASFILNSLELLEGSPSLAQLRGRGMLQRPFTRLHELRRQAELRLRNQQQDLTERIAQTEKELFSWQDGSQGRVEVNDDQSTAEAIALLRSQIVEARRALRAVQRELNHDLERWVLALRFFNIWAMPIALGFFASLLLLLRAWSTRARRA